MTQLWSYKDPRWERIDMNGFEVAARDGAAGRVGERGCEYLVLRTGPWIFRRTAVVPAGLVEHVDRDEEIVYVRVTREEIRSAPEPEAAIDDAGLKHLLSDHYRNAIPAG